MATKELSEIMTDLQKSSDPHAGSLLQKVGNEIKELDGNTIALASNLSALSDRVDDSVEELQESIDNHSQLLFDIDKSKASKEYVNNTIENYTFVASYYTGSSPQDTTWEQFYVAVSSGQYKKFECQVFGDAEAYLLKNMYVEVTANGVDYTFSGSVRDKNYSVKFSQLHPAGGVLEVTESAGGLSSVAHDDTLTGDGTTANPLSVVGGGSGGPSTLFKTVSDMQAASLNVGDVVETAGFYSVGDGGGAKYQIQSTGTPNGMDSIAVAGNKIAKLLVSSKMSTEQIGYQSDDMTKTCNSYVLRLITLGVKNVHFGNHKYWFTRELDILTPDITLEGDGILGNEPTSELCIKEQGVYFIHAERRNFKVKNLTISNRSGTNGTLQPNPSTFGGVGIRCRLWSSGGSDPDLLTSHYGFMFENVYIRNFRRGVELGGNVKWDCRFFNVRTQNCDIGFELKESSFCLEFNLLCVDHCLTTGFQCYGDVNATMLNCNFGSLGNAVKVAKYNESGLAPYRDVQLKFIGCNFECANAESGITNNRGLYVDVEDDIDATLDFDACRFTQNHATGVSSNRCMSFSNTTKAIFKSCEVYVNSDNYNPTLFFDESRPPKDEAASLKFINDKMNLPTNIYGTNSYRCINLDNIFTTEGGGTSSVNLFNGSVARVLNGYITSGGKYMESQGTRTIVVPLEEVMGSLTISMDSDCSNRWVCALHNSIPANNEEGLQVISDSSMNPPTTADGRKYTNFQNINKQYLLVYYVISSSAPSGDWENAKSNTMLTSNGQYTPFVPYSPSSEKKCVFSDNFIPKKILDLIPQG